MKLFQKKSNRLTAVAARAIPIDDDYLNSIMEKIYHSIRYAASRGENKLWYYYAIHPNSTRDIIKQRLELDGYKVHKMEENNLAHLGEWLVSWEE